ncbi:MAG: hypothetical protein GEV03_26480 [Streptosporangiales bacterium]|nr:hypothetical protein [Streptosporangiales bacterium]
MAEAASPDDAELLTAAELAQRAGVAASTITNWTRLKRRPLQTVRTSDGAVRFTWSHLKEFCDANPRLRGVTKIRRRIAGQPLPRTAGSRPATTTPEFEDLKSLARDLRNAAHENLQAALAAARLAEETARSHREQIERLAAAMAAYDAALTQLTASSVPHD